MLPCCGSNRLGEKICQSTQGRQPLDTVDDRIGRRYSRYLALHSHRLSSQLGDSFGQYPQEMAQFLSNIKDLAIPSETHVCNDSQFAQSI